MKGGVLMTEEAECAKLYALFRQLSDPQKREILKKAEILAAAKVRDAPEEEQERRAEGKPE
ncbi:MAG: hypothetical protein LBK13_03865 [Spirochaetales bacterium]|jgi:hypothetical protein|nr:hypothetical protein [Spirochaetales bacterium]